MALLKVLLQKPQRCDLTDIPPGGGPPAKNPKACARTLGNKLFFPPPPKIIFRSFNAPPLNCSRSPFTSYHYFVAKSSHHGFGEGMKCGICHPTSSYHTSDRW